MEKIITNSIKAEDLRYNPWIRWLHSQHRRVHAEKWNILSCVVGLPRTGKSVYATTMSKLINKRFDMNNDVVYTEKQFRHRIEDVRHIGETIIWDEAGVGMSARDWYRIQNKEIGKTLQTIGHLRPVIWFVTPDASYIDSQARKLFHFFFDANHRTNKYTYIRPFNIKVDKRTGKVLYIYPKMVQNGMSKITGIRFHKPPEWFIDQYDNISNPQKMQLRSKSNKLLDSGKKKRFDVSGIQAKIIEEKDVFLNEKGKFDWNIIYLYYKDVLKDAGKPEIQARALAKVCQQVLDRNMKPTV